MLSAVNLNILNIEAININVFFNLPYDATPKRAALPVSGASLDHTHLDSFYEKESPLAITPSAPSKPRYSELICFFEPKVDHGSHHFLPAKSVRVVVDTEDVYRLPQREFEELMAAAQEAFKREGRRLTYENRQVIRVREIRMNPTEAVIHIQPSEYNTQVVTNLTMDLAHQGPSISWRGMSWRQKLRTAAAVLPTLDHNSELANNLGISCLVLTADDQLLVPLRAPLAVFGGQWGICPSFEAQWEPSFRNGREMEISKFLDELMPEHLMLEVGIEARSMTLHPLALCREWLRGGKPQLFMFGKTSLTFNEIKRQVVGAVHIDEVKKRWAGRVFMTEKNHAKHLWSQELVVNRHYAKMFGKTFRGERWPV